METLQKSPAANKLLPSLMVKASNAYGDVAKNVKMPPEIESQMARISLRSILKQAAKSITPADVQQLNAALNKIKKRSNLFVICPRPFSIQIVVLCDLLNTLSEEKKESGGPYRFGKILRAHYIFSLFYPGVRVQPLAFIVAFAALLFPQQGQCNTTLCQLTVNVRIVRFNVQALLYLSGKSIRFGSALVMSSSTGHCMACLSISAKTSRTVCREQ
jgi:hypothetical protein